MMPGAAFDKQRHRIGYKKGFMTIPYKTILIYPQAHPHDICPHYIFTERHIYTKRSEAF